MATKNKNGNGSHDNPVATDEQIDKCLVETHKHVQKVQEYINLFIRELISRAENHDASKFEEPELSGFAAHTARLSGIEYGSDEYLISLHILLFFK